MPIYRPERAQLSFHGEAGHGGYLDVISAATDAGGAATTLTGVHTPGTRSITVASTAGYVVGDYVLIGAVGAANAELRRVILVNSATVMTLDYPLGFRHLNTETVDEKTVNSSNIPTGNSFATFLPGVYEGVTLPDPNIEMLPRYFLGSAARNWYVNYRGRKALAGSLLTFILLNGFPLRFPLGRVNSQPNTTTVTSTTINMAAAFNKGERLLTVTDATGFSAGDYIEISTGVAARREVRQIITVAGFNFTLNYPAMVTHNNADTVTRIGATEAAAVYYTHTITETADLDSVTWHLLMRDSAGTAANDFIRRYVGGMVGRATLQADEGGMLMMSWDDVPFLDMVHNQQAHSGITGDIAFYSGSIIAPTGVGRAIPHDTGVLGTASFPTTQPYYFSRSSISLFGVEFARIRNFRLEISNNVEPRYYLRNTARERVPSEIIEQRRAYTMSATVAMPDSLDATATTRTLWKELIVEGNYDAGLAGFDISMTFTRGTNDDITITIPTSAAAAGGDAQGAFITRAPHPVGTEAPIQVPVEILFRNMSVVIRGPDAVYP